MGGPGDSRPHPMPGALGWVNVSISPSRPPHKAPAPQLICICR